jgi:hypothetical protein
MARNGIYAELHRTQFDAARFLKIPDESGLSGLSKVAEEIYGSIRTAQSTGISIARHSGTC